MMTELEREDIHIISSHSNWSENGVEKELKEKVYNSTTAWKKFLRLFFISLGVCFTASGIIFFFAYNWADLPKFVKIGITEAAIVLTVLVVLLSKIPVNIKNIILTGSSVLVGALFAVFGQVYQTGANAYDFFLGWTVFIALWAIVSDFPPLWLVFLTLLNTTLILYSEQVARDWSEIFVFTLLFVLNTIFLIASVWFSKLNSAISIPVWFSNIIVLTAVSFATLGIIFGITDSHNSSFSIDFLILVLLTTVLYVTGFYYGLKTKSIFYLSIIPFSLIVIVTTIMLKISFKEEMLLLVGLFIVGSVTLLIKTLLDFQKKWKNEN